MYKQVLLLVGLVFLSTFVRSHPVKPAADKTADAAGDEAAAPDAAPEAAGDEAAAPTDAKDAEKGEAPVEENPGDAAEAPSAPSAGGHVAESKIDDAIQKMNELNDLFEEIVQNLGGKTADADAGDAAADVAAADDANPAADADGAAADDANPAADADGAAADAAADADAAATADAAADADAAPAGDAATDAKADAKKV